MARLWKMTVDMTDPDDFAAVVAQAHVSRRLQILVSSVSDSSFASGISLH